MTLSSALVRSPLLWRSRGGAALRMLAASRPENLVMGKRNLSTDPGRLNEDNMVQYHDPHHTAGTTALKQEWDTSFKGIPVLKIADEQEAILADGVDCTAQLYPHASSRQKHVYGETPRVSLLMELTDRVGILHDVLKYFWKFDVNVCRIESRPVQSGRWGGKPKFDFYVDLDGSLEQENVQKLLDELGPMTEKLIVLDERDVHWFPRHISELDLIANRTLDAGQDLESDHPGFTDMKYRTRRAELAESAQHHNIFDPIPNIKYTKEEIETWTQVWDRMEGLWDDYACKEYKHAMTLMQNHCGFSRDNIPQQQDISEFLQKRTGFRMRPVAGLLSSRDFLNGLAFRVFFCTQYIRHHSEPLYTPEPDICHELLGHAPMFADRDFADFSQEIGLASLGASDEDVDKLAHCYWHSVEFGLCRENGQNKAYGAGLLSSFGELEYACSEEHPGADSPPLIMDWDPAVAATQEFPITTYQPVYFLAGSLSDAKQRMREYCEGLQRPFFALHNAHTDSIYIDRPVRRTKGVPATTRSS